MNNEITQIQESLKTLHTQLTALEKSAAGDSSEARALLKVREIETSLSSLTGDPAIRPALDRLETALQDLRNHRLLSLLGSGLGFVVLFLGYAAVLSKEPFKESYSAGVIFEAFLNTVLFFGSYSIMMLLRRGLATSATRITAPRAMQPDPRALTIGASVFVTSLFVALSKTLPRRDGYYDNEILRSWLNTGYSGTVALILLAYADLVVVAISVLVTCWLLKRSSKRDR